MGVVPRTNAPPREPKRYADFLDVMITRFGEHFEWVELWNEPNNRAEWDWTLDPQWLTFCETIGGAAYWAKHRGKKVLLGGMSPVDPNWLELLFERGVMQHVDAVGIHGFPGTWEVTWDGWDAEIAKVQAVLDRHGSRAKVWITEAGYSTWKHNEVGQLQTLLDVMDANAERAYWYAIEDLAPERSAIVGFHTDEREYHFGIVRHDRKEKLLHQLWETGGIGRVREARWITHTPASQPGEVVVTGGAGFVGTNVVDRLLRRGKPVLILDNLSRRGTYENLRWLRQTHGDKARIRVADIRDRATVFDALKEASAVVHLAGQVAVTTSVDHPEDDFHINAQGTLHILEALRQQDRDVPLLFTSTNKVYGEMAEVRFRADGQRYRPESAQLEGLGFGEDRPLDFHSPYGCSKGAADQYVVDYARIYGMPNVVYRMSCIYGPHQHGNEDQGWVAHFLLQTMKDRPITIYGDGRQVRDVLFVEDLVDAMEVTLRDAKRLKGRAFNIGGGPDNTLSLLELVDQIPQLQGGRKPAVAMSPWRPGDQRWYVSDTRAFQEATGWRPKVSVKEGLSRLQTWLNEANGRPATLAPRRAA